MKLKVLNFLFLLLFLQSMLFPLYAEDFLDIDYFVNNSYNLNSFKLSEENLLNNNDYFNTYLYTNQDVITYEKTSVFSPGKEGILTTTLLVTEYADSLVYDFYENEYIYRVDNLRIYPYCVTETKDNYIEVIDYNPNNNKVDFDEIKYSNNYFETMPVDYYNDSVNFYK